MLTTLKPFPLSLSVRLPLISFMIKLPTDRQKSGKLPLISFMIKLPSVSFFTLPGW